MRQNDSVGIAIFFTREVGLVVTKNLKNVDGFHVEVRTNCFEILQVSSKRCLQSPTDKIMHFFIQISPTEIFRRAVLRRVAHELSYTQNSALGVQRVPS